MKLKNVVISGFKSFADKTVLNFGSGIVAIVGPNGCGKSNIVDAFRWVMGEQSAKSIRGDKMHDLIFAGTHKRKPLNIAEVTLTFSNEEKRFPIEYEEVAITRRVCRTSESEYLINRKPVRLKDIESLFWDTGLGKDAYCIFEQGKIDHVIHDSPQERRSIFEEASGILRFKKRKQETLKRLELVAQNLVRASDIHRMVFSQKELLAKQATAAALYKESKSRLEYIERMLFLQKWQSCKSKEAMYLSKINEISAILEKSKEHLAGIEEKEKNIKDQLRVKEALSNEAKDQLALIKGQESLKISVHALEKKQRDELLERESKLVKEQSELQHKKESRLNLFLESKESYFAREKDFVLHAEQFQQARHKFLSLKEEEVALRTKQKEVQQERLKLAQGESKFRAELQEKRLRLETGQERSAYLRFDEERIKKQIEELSFQEKEKRSVFEALSKEIDIKKNAILAHEKELVSLEKLIREQHSKENELQKTLSERSAKRKALVELQEDFEGISKGSKRLLQESKQKKSSLFGLIKPLYEMIEASSGYEKSLGSLLRVYTETLVVENKEDLKKVLEFSKEQGIKEFSIFCMEDIHLPLANADKYSLKNHLSKGRLADHFFDNMHLKTEEEVLLIREVQEKREAGIEYTTKEGFFLDHKKVLFFPVLGEKNTFLREAKIKEFTKEIQEIQETLTHVSTELKSNTVKRDELNLKKSALEKESRTSEMRLVEVNFGLQRLIADKEKGGKELQNNAIEQNKLKNSLEEVSEAILRGIEQESEVKKAFEYKSKQFQEFEESLLLLQEDLKTKEMDLKEKELLHRRNEEEQQRYRRSEEVFNATNKEHVANEERLNNELESILERKKLFDKTIQDLEEEIVALKSALKSQEQVYDGLKKDVAAQALLWKECEKELKVARDSLKKEEDKVHQTELLLVQERALLDSLEEQMTFDELEKETMIDEKLAKSLLQESASLKELLSGMQEVNLAAIDEYEKQKSEEEFLSGQLHDLQASKEELLKIIAKLDQESLKLFTDTFQVVRENFKKNFLLLFEGGDADLQFTDPSNLLDSGIEIIAKPPGKQMRSITLLSGGEKCLTALALLFAIFDVKPSAFCLLDEVDAPLDEMNIDRFTRMLKQFASKTQFLVITHNKRTMAIADLLLGISMEERGVSKLLALEFEAKQQEPVLSLK